MRKFLAGTVGLLLSLGLATSGHAQNINQQCIANMQAGGTANAITIPSLPCALTTNLLIITAASANTSTAVTLQPIGLPAQSIVRPNGAALSVGDISGLGYQALLVPNGSEWFLLNPFTINTGNVVTSLPLSVSNALSALQLLYSSPLSLINGSLALSFTYPLSTVNGVLAEPTVVTNPSTSVSGHAAIFSDNSGKIIADGGTFSTVTSISVNPTQGVSAAVATPSTTPVISIGLSNITPLSVNASGPVSGTQLGSTVPTGTPPIVVNSSTLVSGLSAASATNATNVGITAKSDAVAYYVTMASGPGSAIPLDATNGAGLAFQYNPSVGALTIESGTPQVQLVGNAGGVGATIVGPNTGTAYNFILPNTSGLSGQYMVSGGGVNLMQWSSSLSGTTLNTTGTGTIGGLATDSAGLSITNGGETVVGGTVEGNATGGNQGNGTINATGLFINGASIAQTANSVAISALAQIGGTTLLGNNAGTTGNVAALSVSQVLSQLQAGNPWGSGDINKLRNPDFSINQRTSTGLSPTTSGIYTNDGWIVITTGATANAFPSFGSQQISGALGINSLKVQGTTSVTDITLRQRIESTMSAAMAGQQALCQIKVWNGTGGSITPQIYTRYPGSVDSWGSPSNDLAAVNMSAIGSGATVTEAYAFPVSANAARGYEIDIDLGNNFSTTGKTAVVFDADCRVTPGVLTGIVATPSVPAFRNPGAEWALDLRYFYVIQGGANAPIGNVQIQQATQGIQTVQLPVPMRIAPTGITQTGTLSHFTTISANVAYTATGFSAGQTTTTTFAFNWAYSAAIAGAGYGSLSASGTTADMFQITGAEL